MGILTSHYEAGPVFHPADVAACAEYLAALGHQERHAEFVACWRRRTVRLVAAAAIRAATPLDTHHRLDADLLEHTRVVVGLEGAPNDLAKAVFRHGLAHDVALWVWAVPERRLPAAVRLGFRPLAAAQRRPGRPTLLPMVCVNHDLAHLRAVHSPFARLLTRSRVPLDSAGPRWYRDLSPDVIAAPRPLGDQGLDAEEQIARASIELA